VSKWVHGPDEEARRKNTCPTTLVESERETKDFEKSKVPYKQYFPAEFTIA